MYKKIDEKDIAYLKSFIPENRIVVGEEISHDYAHDEDGKNVEEYLIKRCNRPFSFAKLEFWKVNPTCVGEFGK